MKPGGTLMICFSDFGYAEDPLTNTCVYDAESGVNITAAPAYCVEGMYYNRSEG
jgi:hypothetical protein